MERLHLDNRDYDPHMLTLVSFESERGGKVMRRRLCPKHRVRLLAAIAKTKSGRVVGESVGGSGLCDHCDRKRRKR